MASSSYIGIAVSLVTMWRVSRIYRTMFDANLCSIRKRTEEQENRTDEMGAVEKERNGQREEYRWNF